MKILQISIAQLNPTIGDLEGNFQKAEKAVKMAKGLKSNLVIFPEMATCGYCPKDLLVRPAFIKSIIDMNDRWIEMANQNDISIIFGSISKTNGDKKQLRNVALVASPGKRTVTQAKILLPTYDVFDERRWFDPGVGAYIADVNNIAIGISICEDIWNDKEFWTTREYEEDPIDDLCSAGAQVLVNISASPFSAGKPALRRNMLECIAKRRKKPLIYVNQVGANDDVIYDGRSIVLNSNGEALYEARAFREEVLTCSVYIDDNGDSLVESGSVSLDMDSVVLAKNALQTQFDGIEDAYNALVLGVRDYAQKVGFKKVLIGLSGGIDSALVAAIATEALGKDNVLGVGMPSKYSSTGSVDDARKLAENLGIEFRIIPIKDMHDAYMTALSPSLSKGDGKIGLWEENLQARIRGAVLMAISNEEGRLLLTTGNKSEVAVGYCTLYGDTCGGLAVISDLFKTKVYAMSKWINARAGKEVIPSDTITKPPSAELKPGQVDQDSLPPYEELDEILRLYLEEQVDPKTIVSSIHDTLAPGTPGGEFVVQKSKIVADVIKKVDGNEYKRKQLAPGLKVTKKAFGTGRLIPIVQKWRE